MHDARARRVVAVARTDDYGAGLDKTLDDGGVIRRMIIAEDARTARGLHPPHTDVVLNGNRHPRECLLALLVTTLARPLLNRRDTLQRPLAIDLEKSIQRLIEPPRGINSKLYILTRHSLFAEG